MAENFKNYYSKSYSKKALVIMKSRHAFIKEFPIKNFGYYIGERYDKKVANVFLNTIIFTSRKVKDTDNAVTAISSPHDGTWEAAFLKANKDNLGFDFQNTPFGNDSFDMFPAENNYTYKDMFTGLIYYKPLPEWQRIYGLNNLIDKNFEQEALRRFELSQNFSKTIYKNQKTPEENLKSAVEYSNANHTEYYRDLFPDLVKSLLSLSLN